MGWSIPYARKKVGGILGGMIDQKKSKEWLLSHLGDLAGKQIIVIGDVMLDEYHWCTVKRISPEAPVQVCQVDRTTLVPGGAANVAFNLLTLGGIPKLLGAVGRDSTGEKLLANLSKKGLSQHGLIQTDEKPTVLKSRVVAHHQHVVRVDREDPSPLSRKTRNRLMTQLVSELPQSQAVILSDYAKGTLPEPFIKRIIDAASKLNIPVIVDPKGDDYKRYKGATVLTPNYGEFLAAVKKSVLTEDEILTHGQRLIQRLNLKALVVTRSEKGMSIITNDGNKHDIPTKARDVYDITGAGDTVLATLSMGIAAGWSIEKAVYLANYAAGNVVAKVGTATTDHDEVCQAIERDLDA